ncbi:MAG: hypothetical protein ACHBN1_35440 [Heteroscytonema crispum UTEX LB 1556]
MIPPLVGALVRSLTHQPNPKLCDRSHSKPHQPRFLPTATSI